MTTKVTTPAVPKGTVARVIGREDWISVTPAKLASLIEFLGSENIETRETEGFPAISHKVSDVSGDRATVSIVAKIAPDDVEKGHESQRFALDLTVAEWHTMESLLIEFATFYETSASQSNPHAQAARELAVAMGLVKENQRGPIPKAAWDALELSE